jgi:hypothetical protein
MVCSNKVISVFLAAIGGILVGILLLASSTLTKLPNRFGELEALVEEQSKVIDYLLMNSVAIDPTNDRTGDNVGVGGGEAKDTPNLYHRYRHHRLQEELCQPTFDV